MRSEEIREQQAEASVPLVLAPEVIKAMAALVPAYITTVVLPKSVCEHAIYLGVVERDPAEERFERQYVTLTRHGQLFIQKCAELMPQRGDHEATEELAKHTISHPLALDL